MHVAFQPEGKVTSLVLSSDGEFAAWSEGDGQVFLARQQDSVFTISDSWQASSLVRRMILHQNSLYVLDDEFGLSCLDLNGELRWQHELGAGGFELQVTPSFVALVDGLGRLSLIRHDGTKEPLSVQYTDIVRIFSIGEYIVLAYENGTVQALLSGSVAWTRPVRGEKGESITCIGADSFGNIVIGREGYALVAGDEEVLEIEVWNIAEQRLIHRHDVKSRLVLAVPSANGYLSGFDDGTVIRSSTNSTEHKHEIQLECGYPIRSLVECNNEIMASAWFYIFGRDAAGSEWKIEHQGMPIFLEVSLDGFTCLFAGEDQNDWTEHEPIGQFSLAAPLTETDASELTLWFEKTEETPPPSAEEIYRVDDEMNEFFTPEELASIENTPASTAQFEALHAALGKVPDERQSAALDGSLDVDTEQLLSQLDDAITTMAMLPEEGLLDQLHSGINEVHVPQAVAGDDQHHPVGLDGSVIITLDGTHSHDPQGRIQTWSWIDASGKEIASTSRVKVRLPPGSYRFELRVCDREGQWSSDSLQVVIDEGLVS